MQQAISKETLADIERHVERQVAGGFHTRAEIVQGVLDVFIDDGEPEVLLPLAEKLTGEILRAHLEAQSAWPATTDCDRLDDALAELTQTGVVCRQDFSCCGNCGVAEIGAEMASEETRGIIVRGYAFYHMQDTDAAAEGHGLYLHYGASEPGEEAALRVAHEIVAALHRHGLRTEWNGKWDTRIHVQLDWKRRQPYEVSRPM